MTGVEPHKMKIRVVLLLFLLMETSHVKSQIPDSTDHWSDIIRFDSVKYASIKNKEWAKSDKTITFENQGDQHSAYLTLNEDASFIFFLIEEGPSFLAIGTWQLQKDSTIKLTGDNEKTVMICGDRKESSKYYEYTHFRPLDIRNWRFIKYHDKLLPVR